MMGWRIDQNHPRRTMIGGNADLLCDCRIGRPVVIVRRTSALPLESSAVSVNRITTGRFCPPHVECWRNRCNCVGCSIIDAVPDENDRPAGVFLG